MNLELEQQRMRERHAQSKQALAARKADRREAARKAALKGAADRKANREAAYDKLPLSVRFPYQTKSVYLMAIREHGLCKIGFSENVEKRRQAIEKEIPFPVSVEVIATWETFHYTKLEAALQTILAEQRVKGEWFKLSDADIERCKREAENWLEKHPSIPVFPQRYAE